MERGTQGSTSRRALLKAGSVGLGALLGAPLLGGGRSASEATPRLAQAGAGAGSGSHEINIMALLNPAGKLAGDVVVPEFQRLHPRIKVNWTMVPYAGGYVEKAMLNLVSRGAPFDAIVWWDQYLPQTVDLLEPLDEYIKASKYDMSDFDAAWLDPVRIDGKIYGLPWISDMWTFWYRKDLFEARGLKPPTTVAEVAAAAAALSAPDKNQFGYGLIGKRDTLQTMSWLPLLWGHEGEVLDKARQPVLNQAPGPKAMGLFKDLLKFAPPGSQNAIHSDVISAWGAGTVAMGPMGIGWAGGVRNRSAELMDKQIVMTRIPGKDASSKSMLAHGWPIVMSRYSKRKEQTWAFMSYLMGSDSLRKIVLDESGSASHPVMVRKSIYNDPNVQKLYPWLRQVAGLTGYVRPPFNPSLGIPRGAIEAYDIVALANSKVLAGQAQPAAAANDANSDLASLMKKMGYLK